MLDLRTVQRIFSSMKGRHMETVKFLSRWSTFHEVNLGIQQSVLGLCQAVKAFTLDNVSNHKSVMVIYFVEAL